MDTPRKVLLIGDSTLMAVTEAALSSFPNLAVKRVATYCFADGLYDSIIVEQHQSDEHILAILRDNPNAPIFELDWDTATFSCLLVRRNITLDTEHLSAMICGHADLS